MNRSDFLKKLGIGLGVAVVVPKIFAEESTEEKNSIKWHDINEPPPAWVQRYKYPYTYDECFKPPYTIKLYTKEGDCIATIPEEYGHPMSVVYLMGNDHKFVVTHKEGDYWIAEEQ